VVKEVSKLRQEIDGDIIIYASYQLVQTLIEHDLIDEFRLTVFPVVIGTGERLFGSTAEMTPLRLTSRQAIGESLTLLTYDVVRA
jgi:dihydrofolate reductase